MADKSNDITVKLLAGQEKLERDVAVLKTDMAEVKEGQNRIENFLLNLENIINEDYITI